MPDDSVHQVSPKFCVFSILIPAIFERLDRLAKLTTFLQGQIDAGKYPVEIISVVDNRIVTVGEKRQMVLDASHGDYVAFVDDDDWVEPNYVSAIVEAIEANMGVDVITFDNYSFIESNPRATISMRLGNPNDQINFNGITRRAAWHTCVWRSDLALRSKFPVSSYGEDWVWAEPLNALAKTEHHIDKVLHHYIFNREVSRAMG